MLKDSFCSSPWFHFRVNYNGNFSTCRWQSEKNSNSGYNIKDTSILQFYNSEKMKTLRTDFLEGRKPEQCSDCYYQDKHDKISGRVKQLNKSAVSMDHFDLSLRSSPHYKHFDYSSKNSGVANHNPVDLQIDLGNVCNSACIMCHPAASTRLQQDYIKLNLVNENLFPKQPNFVSWTRDPELLDRFVRELSAIPNIRYIHFLGGETLYDSAFYTLCEKLIELGLSKNIIVGTTTNGTIYDKRVESLISEFKEFHLGISIEGVTDLNDYVRYPSKVETILCNIDKFMQLRETSNVQISLRITPNIFTVFDIDKLFEYMIEHNVIAESCNILTRPAQLKIELLPDDIRKEIIEKLTNLVNKYQVEKTNIVNVRRSDLSGEVINNLIIEYKTFLETYTAPDNVEELRYQLIDFLKSFETIRNNSITDHAPRYTEFLTAYGY